MTKMIIVKKIYGDKIEDKDFSLRNNRCKKLYEKSK